jgi:two-component system nitrate/nitrite response regulator NarL
MHRMSVSSRTGVYIADDHPVFREAIGRVVKTRPEFELLGAASDGREALEHIRALKPAVAVLDQRLPSLDGIDILNAIQREALPTRVLMLTADSSSSIVYDAVRLGVAGFLTKHATLEMICDAIAAVARGDTVLAPDVQAGLVGEVQAREHRERPVLSERESEVLALIADGLSSPEIAARLFISSSTVKTHVKNLCEKLGVSDRAAAVAEAMRRGLLE